MKLRCKLQNKLRKKIIMRKKKNYSINFITAYRKGLGYDA